MAAGAGQGLKCVCACLQTTAIWPEIRIRTVRSRDRKQHDDALAAQELALHLNPSFSFAQNFYAAALTFSGRWKEGVVAADRAMRLNPRGTFVSLNYAAGGFAHYLCGNYTKAIQMSQAAIRLRTDFASAYRVLVASAGMG